YSFSLLTDCIHLQESTNDLQESFRLLKSPSHGDRKDPNKKENGNGTERKLKINQENVNVNKYYGRELNKMT
ncbi:unnamed protein product, partial [Plutella xylostella]